MSKNQSPHFSSRKPFTIVDAWRAAAYPSASPTPEEKAYLDWGEQKEARWQAQMREWPCVLLEDARKKAQQAEVAGVNDTRLRLLRQVRVLEDMAACLGQWFEQEGKLSHDEVVCLTHKYGMLVMRAVRNGLQDHPAVEVFIRGQILTANRALLRLARCGLETLVKTSQDAQEAELDIEIASQHLKGRSLRQIARMIKEKGLLFSGRSLSHTAISKRLKRLRKELPWFKAAAPPISRPASAQKL
jgi:hypothetical protein